LLQKSITSTSAEPVTPRLRTGDLLAAYGLLRPRSYGLDRLGVRRDLAVVGPCVIPGRLIDLGDFPGLLPGEGEVRGDLVRILSRRAGPKLDAYEDFRPGDPTSAYLRVRVRLVRPAVHAWVYVWNGAQDAGPTVAGGDWLRRP
jgi:gamma-glutamylcyclotransferase (GGCT)/AIG2-like uncharacterized protein YtfP